MKITKKHHLLLFEKKKKRGKGDKGQEDFCSKWKAHCDKTTSDTESVSG